MKTNKFNSKNTAWDKKSLINAIKLGRTVYAVFTGRVLTLYVLKGRELDMVVWDCRAERLWLNSSREMDARHTVGLLCGPGAVPGGIVEQALPVKVLNF